MSTLYNWFCDLTREFAAAGVHTSANSGMDAVGNGGGDSATSPSQDSCDIPHERGGNSNGLHVTQASAREGDRHLAIAELDRMQERNGCVVQMDMPRHGVVPADESSASADIISIEMARVQRVMDAHNYAGSKMSKVRFDAEVQAGIERMRAEEEGLDD